MIIDVWVDIGGDKFSRYRPSYNVSPGFNLPVIRREDGQGADCQGQGQDAEQGVVLHCMKWGLIPSFTKKTEKPDHYKMVRFILIYYDSINFMFRRYLCLSFLEVVLINLADTAIGFIVRKCSLQFIMNVGVN